MPDDRVYALLADAVLVLHAAVVVFVVAGLAVIVGGNLGAWRWVNRRGFRLAHAAAIAFVVVQAWLGATCPLTTLEMALRVRAHATPYAGSFVGHWLQRALYVDAPPWAFGLAYSVFAGVVAICWWRFPPEPPPERRRGGRSAHRTRTPPVRPDARGGAR